MRRVTRAALPPEAAAGLTQRQVEADRKRAQGTLVVSSEWKSARGTTELGAALATLRTMAGARARCMYCVDSHGADIEHFWPKTPFPERMFVWPNLLLCCTECGRFKGDRFPLQGGQPLLVDPTAEDPWQHLDFDPVTGNLTPRFDQQANDYSPKGSRTVEVLRLDRREALAQSYKKTLRRLSVAVDRFLATDGRDSGQLIAELQAADDHGLLGWCFAASGRAMSPFSELLSNRPQVWSDCLAVLSASA